MSRSYRKPWVVDGYGTTWKRFAKAHHNRKVRRKLKNPKYEISDGSAHKNGAGLNRWDVCDYKWLIRKPFKDMIQWGYIETIAEQNQTYSKAKRK